MKIEEKAISRVRVCFVTGTRAEFGLMRSTLEAIRAHPKLELQLVVTGMHLHAAHGRSIDTIRKQGWSIDATVRWPLTGHKPSSHARQMGLATAELASTISHLRSDVILVVGDRVEAFAAAAAGHVSRRVVAHVHGGDRAEGMIDDSLRHAISKLAHVHFAATRDSADRLKRLGEDSWRIHQVGTPGLDGIRATAAPTTQLRERFPLLTTQRFALVALHPIVSSGFTEEENADALLSAVQPAGIEQIVVIYPNNDPGSHNIIRVWERRRREITYLLRDVPRNVFLGLMRDAAVMVGNSSAGIIEAASFGTPVIDVGSRQKGRLRSQNVTNVPYGKEAIRPAVARVWNNGHPRRFTGRNVYGGGGAGKRIARILAGLPLDEPCLRRKLIAY